MSGAAIGLAVADIVLTRFLKWQEQRAREAGYVPSMADKEAFLEYIRNATTESIQEEVAREEGGTGWKDRKPPKPEDQPEPPQPS